MTRLNKKYCLLWILVLLSPLFSAAQQNLFNYENSLRFARYLGTTKQYAFAAEEYERLNFLYPDDTTVIFELVQTYRFNHQCAKLRPSFGLLSENGRIYNTPVYTKEYLRFVLDCKVADPDFFNLVSLLPPEDKTFYTLGYYWVNQSHDSLFGYYKHESSLLKPMHRDLFELTQKFESQKYKSPTLALMMSAIIPGSGKAYTKRWSDAVFSFLFVGANSYASYRAFHKKGAKSINGWIFGGLAFSFYSANLYGSAKAARNYNNSLRETYQNNAENIIYNSY
jgi:hypothetical protein